VGLGTKEEEVERKGAGGGRGGRVESGGGTKNREGAGGLYRLGVGVDVARQEVDGKRRRGRVEGEMVMEKKGVGGRERKKKRNTRRELGRREKVGLKVVRKRRRGTQSDEEQKNEWNNVGEVWWNYKAEGEGESRQVVNKALKKRRVGGEGMGVECGSRRGEEYILVKKGWRTWMRGMDEGEGGVGEKKIGIGMEGERENAGR